jgi:GTP pyrophosphokinase
VRDLRVILVKLADRLHNMRTIEGMASQRRRAIARETLDIYAPIAERLGLYAMKLELEDLGFLALYPRRYKVIEKALKRARGNQKEFLTRISENIGAALSKAGIEAEVEAREKHLYSIYRKMQRKRTSLSEIVDVYGLRVIVESVDHCYRALGVVHGAYRPMPGRFKDYIAIPRVNGYQSLHTTLFGPNGLPIEAQIRTRDMHRVSESGIAAHWKYKSGEASAGHEQARAREWLSNLISMQEAGSSEEFLESVRLDLFPDKVYVFTPKGKILRLPRGATVVDFAYAVHTDVGNRCVAAKVDRRLAPLRTQLRNGQTVEIVTAPGAIPNPSWVNFVVTAKARAAIRQYLKGLRRSEAIELGQRLVNQSLAEFDLSLTDISETALLATAGELGMVDADELFEKVGMGERLAPLIARRLGPAAPSSNASQGGEAGESAPAPLAIAGTEGLLVSYARCCFPVPGDPILAYLSSGRGIIVHREDCANVDDYRKHPEKWISVTWAEQPGRMFGCELRVEVQNRMGVLAAVASAIAGTETNIDHVELQERDTDTSVLVFEVRVRDRQHLASVMRVIRRMPDVLRLSRTLAVKTRDE